MHIVKLFLALVMLAVLANAALAQSSATVVGTCGTLGQAYVQGSVRPLTQDTAGALCTGAGGGGAAAQVQGNVASGAADSGNPVKVGAIYNSTKPTFTNLQRGDLQIGTRGSLHTTVCSADSINCAAAATAADAQAGATGLLGTTQNLVFNGSTYDRWRSMNIGDGAASTGIAAVGGMLFDGTNYDRWRGDGTGSAFVTPQAAATGGCTPGKTLSAATTNATSIKAAAGTLCTLIAINTTATIYYLKLYNTVAAPTCNSDTVVMSIPVPANTSGSGYALPLGPFGIAFTTGIGLCLTGALADNDNTAAATGVAISYGFK